MMNCWIIGLSVFSLGDKICSIFSLPLHQCLMQNVSFQEDGHLSETVLIWSSLRWQKGKKRQVLCKWISAVCSFQSLWLTPVDLWMREAIHSYTEQNIESYLMLYQRSTISNTVTIQVLNPAVLCLLLCWSWTSEKISCSEHGCWN